MSGDTELQQLGSSQDPSRSLWDIPKGGAAGTWVLLHANVLLATPKPVSKSILASQGMILCCLTQNRRKYLTLAEVLVLSFSFHCPRCKLSHECNRQRGNLASLPDGLTGHW